MWMSLTRSLDIHFEILYTKSMSKTKPGHGNTRYEVITQEDPESGDLLLPIPQVLLDQLGWKEGDEIDFGLDEQGHYILQKK